MARFTVYLTAEVSVRQDVAASTEVEAIALAVQQFDRARLGAPGDGVDFIGLGSECIVSETFGAGGMRWHTVPIAPSHRHDAPLPMRRTADASQGRHFPFNDPIAERDWED